MSLGILAIGLINEALDEGDAQKTLQALQIPAAKLEGVLPEVAQHYQDTLIRAKREKAQVSMHPHPPPHTPTEPCGSDSAVSLWEERCASVLPLLHLWPQERQMLHLLGTQGILHIPLLQMSLCSNLPF